MLIEVTDDMVSAYDEASWNNPQASHGAEFPNVREGLAAVLAIVGRDYRIEPKPSWEKAGEGCGDHPGSPCWKRDWVGEPYLPCEVPL